MILRGLSLLMKRTRCGKRWVSTLVLGASVTGPGCRKRLDRLLVPQSLEATKLGQREKVGRQAPHAQISCSNLSASIAVKAADLGFVSRRS